MATDGKTRYQRAKELAAQRGYASPWAERNARAQARGLPNEYARRKESEKARGRQRDYALERERADIRARAKGFSNARERARFNKETRSTPGLSGEKWQKQRTLDKFGINEREFNRIRKLNREWSREYPMLQWTAINTYDTFRDSDVNDWSEARVGYILAFYAAIVNPKSNYDSLTRNRKRRLTKDGKPVTNKSQFYYLVKYAGIMSVDEYEARYGSQAVRDAQSGKLEIE